MSGVCSDRLVPVRCGEDSNYAPSLGEKRVELRLNTSGRMYVVDSIQDLFDNFFPPPPKGTKQIPNIFGNVRDFNSESDMYGWFTTTLSASKLYSGFVVVATPHKSDPNDPSKQAIDCGMYAKKYAPTSAFTVKGDESRRVNWGRLELSHEFKYRPSEQDPVDESRDDFEPIADERKRTLGQILSYAELVFKYQQRQFHYMVLWFPKYARVIRFDRSGLVATRKLWYKTHGQDLTEFLARYGRLGSTNRGHDPTAVRIEADNPLFTKVREYTAELLEKKPGDHAARSFNSSLDKSWPMWKLLVHDERLDEDRWFVVGKPHFSAPGVTGRGTRGYVGLPLDKDDEPHGAFVHIKDAWRIEHPSLEKEGCVLEKLNAAKVRFVPTLVCHGDLGQTTVSFDKWSKLFPGQKCTMKPHQHYRLVVKEVGKPLHEFENGAHLVLCMLSVVIAHWDACNAGYIHRDISSGNILLCQTPDGEWVAFLNDWELSTRFVDGAPVVQTGDGEGFFVLDRTGTWQYQSAHALLDRDRLTTVADDLESVFHVLILHGVRFLPHNIEDHAVGKFLKQYFDDYSDGSKGIICGPAKYHAMYSGEIALNLATGGKKDEEGKPVYEELQFRWPGADAATIHPLNELVKALLSVFRRYYALDKKPQTQGKEAQSGGYTMPGTSKLFLSISDDPSPSPAPVEPVPDLTPPQNVPDAAFTVTHATFMNELKKYIPRKWPQGDKGLDKRPKSIPREEKVNVPTDSANVASNKRSLDDGDASASKRQRSAA